MYERLLILEPGAAQASRLGDARVKLANLAGLLIGVVAAVALIAALMA